MIKPMHIEPGATVGIVAPASAAKDPSMVDAAVRKLEELGFRVRVGRHVRSKRGFLVASVGKRLADLHAMFADKRVDAVMCMRGGYGAMQLLEGIDYALVRRNPKVFSGFSDVTALSLAFLRKCGMVSFNGPMAVTTFAKEPPRVFPVESFLRTVGIPRPAGSVWEGCADRNFRVVRHGSARGILTGGNLSLVAATVGTPYEIETRGRIVFLEEVDEKPYRVDRMLTQLMLAEKLKDAAGIVFGRNVPDAETAELEAKLARKGITHVARPTPAKVTREYEQTTDDVIAERLLPLGIPVMIGVPFGHVDDYCTLPLGVRAEMNTRNGELSVIEAAVR
jgi:muramoyltetrapeptide carboxypeptidase